MGLRASVIHGRLVLDEPTALPEGTVLELVVDDEGDDLTDEERRLLHDELDASLAEADRDDTVAARDVLEALRRR